MNTTAHDEIEQRIRRTLSTVASTVTEDSAVAPARPSPYRRSRRLRWIGLGLGLAVVPVTVAAVVVRQGPEYVDTIPPETIIATGSVDGSRYLLVESRRTDKCGPVTGVELVEESENLLGSEWNTVGSAYGEPNACGRNAPTDRYLADPSLFDDGGTTVGDSFVWLWAVHPDVTAVRVRAGGTTEDLAIHDVDGAGYALYEVPANVRRWSAELLIDGQPVPGSAKEHTLPAP